MACCVFVRTLENRECANIGVSCGYRSQVNNEMRWQARAGAGTKIRSGRCTQRILQLRATCQFLHVQTIYIHGRLSSQGTGTMATCTSTCSHIQDLRVRQVSKCICNLYKSLLLCTPTSVFGCDITHSVVREPAKQGLIE